MFEFLRNLTKSAEEKRQETIAGYVDGALNGRSRQQFEQAMAQDEALRQEVAQLQLIKQSLRQLPQREVPRNFILDPAEFSRPPARQPWVQAYPVLRTATAMAAFFFIFAVAAGIFTGFGTSAEPLLAPVADVTQVEEMETTRVVTEAVESLAYEAESAAEEEIVAEEEMAADTAVEAEADSFDAAEEETAAESAAEEEAVPAEPAAVPQEELAEDGESAPEATAVPQLTTEPLPTPTVSTIPRITSPTPLPDRDLESAEVTGETANEAVADAPPPVVEEEGAAVEESTAVPTEEAAEVISVEQPTNPLLWWQVGLGALLLLLVGLTLYARRQR